MFTTKNESSNAWPTSAVRPERDRDRHDREHDRHERGHDRAEHEQEHDERRSDAEELAGLQILVGGVAEVRIGGVAARDVRLEILAALCS